MNIMNLTNLNCRICGQYFNPIGPGRFFDAYVPGGDIFSSPLKNDFLPQESIIFHPEIKFGIILEVF